MALRPSDDLFISPPQRELLSLAQHHGDMGSLERAWLDRLGVAVAPAGVFQHNVGELMYRGFLTPRHGLLPKVPEEVATAGNAEWLRPVLAVDVTKAGLEALNR